MIGREDDETPWSCAVCTFLHSGTQARFLRCAVCDAERPAERPADVQDDNAVQGSSPHSETEHVECQFNFTAGNELELSFLRGPVDCCDLWRRLARQHR